MRSLLLTCALLTGCGTVGALQKACKAVAVLDETVAEQHDQLPEPQRTQLESAVLYLYDVCYEDPLKESH